MNEIRTHRYLLAVFSVSFVLNLVWENAHVFLYDNYKNGPITESILLHATLMDAIFISLMALCIYLVPPLKSRTWAIIPVGIIVAVGIEWWALGSGRWAYNAFMPVLPVLGTGLTPTIQLGLLGYVSMLLAEKINKKA